MISYSALRAERRAATVWLTMNRPETTSALSGTLCDELADAIGRVKGH